MIAMDETAVFMGQDSQTTVDIRGHHQSIFPQQVMKAIGLTVLLHFVWIEQSQRLLLLLKERKIK